MVCFQTPSTPPSGTQDSTNAFVCVQQRDFVDYSVLIWQQINNSTLKAIINIFNVQEEEQRIFHREATCHDEYVFQWSEGFTVLVVVFLIMMVMMIMVVIMIFLFTFSVNSTLYPGKITGKIRKWYQDSKHKVWNYEAWKHVLHIIDQFNNKAISQKNKEN